MISLRHRTAVLFFFALAIGSRGGRAAGEITLDSDWKKKVFAFVEKELRHSAWGFAHSKRDYLVAREIGEREGLKIDEEVIFAAAFLHDMGGFPKYEKAGTDHAVRSAEIVHTVLEPFGFPMGKIEAVRKAILTHSYYCDVAPTTPEGLALHDADTLDFLGIIGVTRILSITEQDQATPNLAYSLRVVRGLYERAPKSLISKSARSMAATRIAEMKQFLERLKSETFDLSAL